MKPSTGSASSWSANNMVLIFGSSITALAALLIAYSRPAASFNFQENCAELAHTLDIDNATISFSQYVGAGTNITFPDNPESCTRPAQVVPVDICRVVMSVATSSRSKIRIEAWLPQASNWTGRVLSTGNGGIGGCIQFEDLAYGASLGFATLGSNGGHDGMTGVPFLNNEDVIADFAWRALHTTSEISKTIAPQFYGKDYTKSYYLGCSTGGRQGWKSAQSYPSDFDGIVAGSPALAFNNLTSWSGTFYQIFTAAGPDGFPPQSAWPAIDASILSQCDTLDGANDSVVETAALCNAIFRPEALICASNATNTSTCITPLQASTLRTLFTPLYASPDTLVYPSLPVAPGVAALAYSVYAPAPFLYTSDWFKYAVYNNPNFSAATLTPSDWAYAWAQNAGDVNTWSGDLSAFRDRGSKILTYHGQADGIITPLNSERYYNYVSRTMDATSDELDEFYRFFRIAGMGHCSGGNGPVNIGQGLASEGASLDAQDNVLMAVVKWVEEGVAPDTITGTKYVGEGATSAAGSAGTGPKEVEYTRANCRYPLRNVYEGGAWKCV